MMSVEHRLKTTQSQLRLMTWAYWIVSLLLGLAIGLLL